MWQCTCLDRDDLLEILGAKHFYEVKPANRDIRELAARIACEIDVIRDRAGIEHLDHFEWRPGVENHNLAGVFERKPNLFPIR